MQSPKLFWGGLCQLSWKQAWNTLLCLRNQSSFNCSPIWMNETCCYPALSRMTPQMLVLLMQCCLWFEIVQSWVKVPKKQEQSCTHLDLIIVLYEHEHDPNQFVLSPYPRRVDYELWGIQIWKWHCSFSPNKARGILNSNFVQLFSKFWQSLSSNFGYSIILYCPRRNSPDIILYCTTRMILWLLDSVLC